MKNNVIKLTVLLCMLAVSSSLFALADEYNRNGECYLLVGYDDADARVISYRERGVYRLNDPAKSGEQQLKLGYLYNPLSSWGLSVDINRNIYTFGSQTDNYILKSDCLNAELKNAGDYTLFGAHCDTRGDGFWQAGQSQLHREIYTTSGPTGNYGHTDWVYNYDTQVCWDWSGRVRPICWWANNYGGYTYLFYKINDWCCHACMGRTSRDYFRSDYSYGGFTWSNMPDPKAWMHNTYAGGVDWVCYVPYWPYKFFSYNADWWALVFVTTDSDGCAKLPNNAWYQSRERDHSGRVGNAIYWDCSRRKYTRYNLNLYKDSYGFGTSVYPQRLQNDIDRIYDEMIFRRKISACINVSCLRHAAAETFAAQPKYVSIAKSPINTTTYLYSRTKTSNRDGRLSVDGQEVTASHPLRSNLRGDKTLNKLTTQWVGISAKDKITDFVYLLGDEIIKEWLAKYAGINPTALSKINISHVAVSDQWWLDGGIIYAYDKKTGQVYKFLRNDRDGADALLNRPEVFSIELNADEIAADGDGHLYYALTNYTPSKSSFNKGKNAATFSLGGRSGNNYTYTLIYRQDVRKQVKCRENGAKSSYNVGDTSDLAKGIIIGYREYEQNVTINMAASQNLGLASKLKKPSDFVKYNNRTWQWGFLTEKPNSDIDYKRVQLSVINAAKPPDVLTVYGDKGRIDVVLDGASTNESYLKNGDLIQDKYTFRAENMPYWSGRNNVVTPGKEKWAGDENQNGFEGGFMSSVMHSSSISDSSPELIYTWKIYKTQDAFFNKIEPELVTSAESSSPRISYYFTSGVYQIHCKASFKYYNYDALPFGSTYQDIASCIKGPATAIAAPVSGWIKSMKDRNGLPTYLPPEEDYAVAAIKVNRQEKPPTGEQLQIERLAANGSWVSPSKYTYTKNGKNKTLEYHEVMEDVNATWRLKDPNERNNGKYLKHLYDLPIITDSNLVPGSLAWEDDVGFVYSISRPLPNGDNEPIDIPGGTKKSVSPETAPHAFAITDPTDPVFAVLKCRAFRTWIYYKNVYDSYGNWQGTERVTGDVEYYGTVNVLVADRTPPQIVSINGITELPAKNWLLKGETGKPVPNTTFAIEVKDNNIYSDKTNLFGEEYCDKRRAQKQCATLFFERGRSKEKIPAKPYAYQAANSPEIKHFSCPEPAKSNDGSFKITRTPKPYEKGDKYSYTKYIFNCASWRYLQTDADKSISTDNDNCFPIDMANNSSAWNNAGGVYKDKHLGYALGFTAFDNSGNSVNNDNTETPWPLVETKVANHSPGLVYLGRMTVKDTLKPICYAEITDYKGGAGELQPYGIDKYLKTSPFNSADKKYPWYGRLPEVEVWEVGSNFKYPHVSVGTLWGIPHNLAQKPGDNVEVHPKMILAGTEIFIKLYANDNIQVLKDTGLPTPKLIINGPVGLYKEKYARSFDKSENTFSIASSENGGKGIRLLLQYSGVYNIELSCKDNALEYDGVTPSRNRRVVKFAIIAAPVSADIRTIDKLNMGL